MATKIQMQRRARLIALLRRVPRSAWYMTSYFYTREGSTPHWWDAIKILKRYVDRRRVPQTYCNTAACLAGWAATQWPEVYAEGSYRAYVFMRLFGVTWKQQESLTQDGFHFSAKEKARHLEMMK